MSIQLFLADKIVRITAKRRFARNPDVFQLRPMMQSMEGGRVPKRIALEATSLDGIPTERVAAVGANPKRAILYIHGGGFVAGKPSNHRALTWRLAEKLGVAVYAIDYRLAPENPFPAALDDCVTAYRALLASGFAAGGIVVGGDSAGGNLALALALKLKQTGVMLPAALFCLSPTTERASVRPSAHENARADAMFDLRMFNSVTRHYCPNHDPADPLISPLRGDVSGFPPTLLQCSRDEMLRDESVQMAEKLKAAGVDVKLEVWPRVFHVWHLMADLVPESRKAIDNIVAFVAKRWAV